MNTINSPTFLQITRNLAHGTQTHSYAKNLELIGLSGEQVAFVFVVPKTIAENFKYHQFLNKNGKAKK